MQKINDTYSIIKGQNKPLSCDVAIIEKDDYVYVFEAGNGFHIASEINNIKKEKILIISHFHLDHLNNYKDINYSKLYVSKNTYKYTNVGIIVDNNLQLDEDIKIIQIKQSHEKGGLGLIVGDYCLIGDALAPKIKNNECYYNTQLFLEELNIFSELDAKYFVSSHHMSKLISKPEILEYMRNIYSKRELNNPIIRINN